MMNKRFSRRTLLKFTGAGILSAGVVSASSLMYVYKVEPNWVDVSSVALKLPRLAPEFDGFRLAQISDIHMGTGITRERLFEVVDTVNALNADAVAVTGDLVTWRARRYRADLTDALSAIHAPAYAIPGNHDYWGGISTFRDVLADSGIMNLSNDAHTLYRGNAMLHIAGLDDIFEKRHRIDAVLEKLPREGAVVLLAHEPDIADVTARTGRFDLQISGHSHGGQVSLPFVGAPFLPTLGQKYPRGLYHVNGMYQYTNRGIGMVYPAVRFNCRPEITVFTLQA